MRRRIERRHFLKAAAAGGAAGGAGLGPGRLADGPAADESNVPTVTLGRTGEKVTILGMGTSWALSPSFVQAAVYSGRSLHRHLGELREHRAEKVLGDVLDRTKLRKDVYLVTKNAELSQEHGHRHCQDVRAASQRQPRAAQDRPRRLLLPARPGRQPDRAASRPGVKAAFEALKKQGKTHFCGLSCHDARLPEILEAAVDCGWIDQVMFKFNFRDVGGRDRHDDLQRAIDKAVKANLGLIAMKTQGGAINFPDKMAELQAKGFKKEVAAVKTVWMDGRIHVAVSEMTTRSDLRENVAASGDQKLTRSRSEAAGGLPPGHGPPLLPRLRPPLRDCRQGRAGRHRAPLPAVLRGLRQAAGGPRPLPGASARRPRPRRGQSRRRRRGLPPRPARGRAGRAGGQANAGVNKPTGHRKRNTDWQPVFGNAVARVELRRCLSVTRLRAASR